MRKKDVEKVNLLNTIPVHGEQVLTDWDNGCAVLVLPRFRQKWMQRWLFKGISPYVRVQLEEHGTAVWKLIDGKRTVGEIITLLASHFEGETDYESRITTYLMRMQKDRLIRLLYH